MTTTEVNPSGVAALGKTKLAFVTTLASPTAVTTAELAAAGAVNLSFYIPGSEFPIDVTQNTGQDIRLASVQVFDVLGQISYQIPDVSYIVDPQTPGTTTPAGILTVGLAGYIVIRYGILATTDWAIADKVDIYPVTMGAYVEGKTTSDEFGLFTQVQKVVVRSTATRKFAIAA